MNERAFEILNQLIHTYYPIRIYVFQEKFEVTSRTIRNDIFLINEFLLDNELPTINIIRGKGILLNLTDKEIQKLEKLIQIKKEVVYLTREERILDILLSVALTNEKVFLNKKEVEYLVSKSTIDEDMRQLRLKLNSYDIQLNSNPKHGLILKGKESTIRTMLYSVVCNEFTKDNYWHENINIIHKHIPKKMILDINQIFTNTFEMSKDSLQQLHLYIFTYIWISRVKQENFISNSELPIGKVDISTSLEKYFNDICSKFEIKASLFEKDYILKILQSFNFDKNINQVDWLHIQLVVFDLIQFVENRTGISFSRKEEDLHKSLYIHMISMATRVQNNIQLVNPLKDKIERNYGLVYQAVKEFSPILNKLFCNHVSEDELAFLTIHFSTILSEINQEIKRRFRAVVVCNYGIATSKLLSENLKEYFNIDVIALLSSTETSIIDKLDVDLVFSTIEIVRVNKPLLVIDSVLQEDSKYQIREFLSNQRGKRRISEKESDYTTMLKEIISLLEERHVFNENLYSLLESLFIKYGLSINKKEVQPMIQDILIDSNILINKQKLDWREAIAYSASSLLKSGVITENYIKSMIHSVEEFGPYIVMAPHMALAHARPEDGVNKLGFSVSIFKNPVSFGDEDEQQVSVIFCLSAVDSYSHLNIMKSLINLIRSTDKIEKLSKAISKEEVKNILLDRKRRVENE